MPSPFVPLGKLQAVAFPMERAPRGWLLATGSDVVKQSVLAIIDTEPGERPMMPSYGTSKRRYLFEQNDDVLTKRLEHEMETALATWEPRVQVLSLDVDVDRVVNVASYRVTYKILATGQEDTADGEIALQVR